MSGVMPALAMAPGPLLAPRMAPRWSVVGAPAPGSPLLIAGLLNSVARVGVAPPWKPNPSRSGFVLGRSPGPVRLPVPSLLMLWPDEVMVLELLPISALGVPIGFVAVPFRIVL